MVEIIGTLYEMEGVNPETAGIQTLKLQVSKPRNRRYPNPITASIQTLKLQVSKPWNRRYLNPKTAGI